MTIKDNTIRINPEKDPLNGVGINPITGERAALVRIPLLDTVDLTQEFDKLRMKKGYKPMLRVKEFTDHIALPSWVSLVMTTTKKPVMRMDGRSRCTFGKGRIKKAVMA